MRNREVHVEHHVALLRARDAEGVSAHEQVVDAVGARVHEAVVTGRERGRIHDVHRIEKVCSGCRRRCCCRRSGSLGRRRRYRRNTRRDGPAKSLPLPPTLGGRRRTADARGGLRESGERAGADDLIDVPGDALRVGAGGRSAGIDLEFLLTEAREHRHRRVVVSAIDGDAVESRIRLGRCRRRECAPSGTIPIRPDPLHAGNRRDGAVGVIETARADQRTAAWAPAALIE